MVTYNQERSIQKLVIARGENTNRKEVIYIEITKNLEATVHAREIKEQAKNKLENKGNSDWMEKPWNG